MGISLSGIGDGLSNLLEEAQDLGSSAMASVQNFASGAVETFEDIGETVTEAYNVAADFVDEKVDEVADFFAETAAAVAGWFEDTAAYVAEVFDSAVDAVGEAFDSFTTWCETTAIPALLDAGAFVLNILEDTAATLVTFVVSLVEGILEFGETLVDLIILIGGVLGTIGTGIYDGYQAVRGWITGEEWESATAEWWEEVMGVVSVQAVESVFDSMYEDTAFGQWLAGNAYGFDIVRGAGRGIGYVTGLVLLTIATFGTGTVATAGATATSAGVSSLSVTSGQLAVTAAAMGFSSGTEDAWADGADLMEGFGYGTVNAAFEGVSFFLGSKVAGVNPFKGSGSKVLNSLTHVALDGAQGGIEGFFQSLMSAVYEDGYYNENGEYIEFTEDDGLFTRLQESFDDAGGFQNVLTNAIIGSGGSLIGEGFDLTKFLKDSNIDVAVDSRATASQNVDVNISGAKIDFEAQISKVNYETAKGHFVSLDIGNTKNISFEDLNKINNPENVIFRLDDGTTLDYKGVLDTKVAEIDANRILDDDITALMEKATANDFHIQWAKEQLSSLLHYFFDARFGADYIDNIINTIHSVPEEEWLAFLKSRGLSESIVGFVDGNSELYLPSNASMHASVHEALHKLSEWQGTTWIDPTTGQTRKVTGIREVYQNADGSLWYTTMTNETLTDYLASKYSDNKIYVTCYDHTGNTIRMWEKLDQLLFQKYGDNTILLDAYLNNDTSFLRQFFDENAFIGAYDSFVLSLEHLNDVEVNAIVDKIEKSVTPSGMDKIVNIIKGIFGGNK